MAETNMDHLIDPDTDPDHDPDPDPDEISQNWIYHIVKIETLATTQ